MRDPETILAEDPGSVVFSRYAEQLARAGRIEQAVDVLKRGIQANPFHAPGYSVLAELLFQLESEEEAVENIMTALRLDPQMPRDLFRLGAHYLDRDPSQAELLLKTAFAYEPESEDVGASFEKARLLAESSGSGGNIPVKEGKISFHGENLTADDEEISPVGAVGKSAFVEEDIQVLFQKPPTTVNKEDQDFLDLIGEQGGGTIDEELDSLFKSLETKSEKPAITLERKPEESVFDEMTVPADEVEEGDGLDLTRIFPETGENDLADEDIESSVDEIPRDVRDDYLVSDETASLGSGEESLVEEVEEKKDFFDAVTPYGEEAAEEDIDTLFESLAKDRNLEIPLPELEKSETGAILTERKDSGIESEPGSGEMLSGDMADRPYEEQPADYGIVDFEKEEAETGSVLEITDEEEYDLSRFGYDAAPEEELPVLTDAERTELMALTVPHMDEIGEEEKEEERSGLGGLTLEDLDKPDYPGTDERNDELSDNYDTAEDEADASDSLIDENEMEDLAGEGIDYSDVISAWKLPGEGSVPPGEDEMEPLSIADVLGNMTERETENPEEIPSSDGLLPEETDIPETEAVEENGMPVSGTVENVPVLENEDARSIIPSSGETDDFSIPLDGLFQIDSAFHPLTAEQTALIDDFISGKDAVPEPEFPASIHPASGLEDRDVSVPEQVARNEDKDFSVEFIEPISRKPESELETTLSENAPEPEIYRPVEADEEQRQPFSPESDSPAFALPIESPLTVGPAQMADMKEKEEKEESLDDLINLYQDILVKHAPRMTSLSASASGPVSMPSPEMNSSPAHETERKPRSVSKPLGSYTATMAEIYVSQGLITRAMDIYTVLAENTPANEQYRLRLTELKRLHEQQSDAS